MAGTSQRGKRRVWLTLAALALTIAVLLLSGTIGVDLLGGPPWFFLAVGLGRLFLILASIMLGFGALAMLMRTVAPRAAAAPAAPKAAAAPAAPGASKAQRPDPPAASGS